jgi:hypothetical protein
MQLISGIELFEILKAKIGEKEDLANAKAELEIKMEKIRSDIIKWMFIFWVGQIGALIAILQIFFGK